MIWRGREATQPAESNPDLAVEDTGFSSVYQGNSMLQPLGEQSKRRVRS